VRLGQRGVVKLDLHIDDVGYSHARQFRHVLLIPYAAAESDAAGNPRNVHPQFPFSPEREINSATSIGRYKSCLPLLRFN
jgi:hypothetical protein